MDTKTVFEDIQEKKELGFSDKLIHKLTGYALEEIRKNTERWEMCKKYKNNCERCPNINICYKCRLG